MTLKDIINNFKMTKYALTFETKNPFLKNELEELLKSHNIEYGTGYMEMDGIYAYGVLGAPNKETVMQVVDIFKHAHPWKYHYSKHGWFKTRITCLCWI